MPDMCFADRFAWGVWQQDHKKDYPRFFCPSSNNVHGRATDILQQNRPCRPRFWQCHVMYYGWHGPDPLFYSVGSKSAQFRETAEAAFARSLRASQDLCEYNSPKPSSLNLMFSFCGGDLSHISQSAQWFTSGDTCSVTSAWKILQQTSVLPQDILPPDRRRTGKCKPVHVGDLRAVGGFGHCWKSCPHAITSWPHTWRYRRKVFLTHARPLSISLSSLIHSLSSPHARTNTHTRTHTHTHTRTQASFSLIVRFGRIWVHFRNSSTLSVQEYERSLRSVFQERNSSDMTKTKFEVIDIFAIPDYHEWLSGCIDRDLSK